MNKDLLIELRKAVDNKKLSILDVNVIQSLKGKRIQTIYFGYDSQDDVKDFIVGEVISQFDLAKRHKVPDFNNMAEYWEHFLPEDRLNEYKNTLTILDNEGRQTFINAHPFNNGKFTCSDDDRFVFYRIIT